MLGLTSTLPLASEEAIINSSGFCGSGLSALISLLGACGAALGSAAGAELGSAGASGSSASFKSDF